jgi:hypothetical protein
LSREEANKQGHTQNALKEIEAVILGKVLGK